MIVWAFKIYYPPRFKYKCLELDTEILELLAIKLHCTFCFQSHYLDSLPIISISYMIGKLNSSSA